MKRHFGIFIMLIMILLVACNSPNSIDRSELDEYEVNNTSAETIQDDFVFRLVSEKEGYKEGEKVKLYGELEYVGKKPEVTIYHSSFVFQFSMEEKIRGYHISDGVNDIGLTTTLKQGEAHREAYAKSGAFFLDESPEDYVKFIEDFLDRDDFPMGYYVVKGYANFAAGPGDDAGERERFDMEATIDFKVVE